MSGHCSVDREFLSRNEKKRVEHPCTWSPYVGDLRNQFFILLAGLSLQRIGELLAVACDHGGPHQRRGSVKIPQQLLSAWNVVAYDLT